MQADPQPASRMQWLFGAIALPAGWRLGAGPVIAALVLVVIVPVFVFLPLVIWRYRLSRQDSDYRPDWRFSWVLEGLIWGVPILIVAMLGVSLWQTVHRIDPYDRLDPGGPDPVKVEVVGLDWKFLFIYPDEGVASVNELVVPAGREVAFTLTADGPMMSFMVPRLGSQIYAMAGMKTQLHLVADHPGNFRGMNTQFNGSHFHEQKFVLKARDEAAYHQWLNQARAAPPLDEARYAELAQPGTVARPLIFGSVSSGLFDTIMAKYDHPAHAGRAIPEKAALRSKDQAPAMTSARGRP